MSSQTQEHLWTEHGCPFVVLIVKKPAVLAKPRLVLLAKEDDRHSSAEESGLTGSGVAVTWPCQARVEEVLQHTLPPLYLDELAAEVG